MWHWLRQLDPIWISLGPLLALNVFMLGTVVYFRKVRREQSLEEAEKYLDKRHHSKLLNKWMKEYWYWLTSPVERMALKLRLTPNFFTTLGFILSLGSAAAFYYGRLGLAGWLMIIGGSCDMFDGRIARATGLGSKSGAFYDSVMDRYGELVVFAGLAALYRDSWVFWFVIAGIIGATMVSYNRARGQAVGIDCDVGAMQRPERIVYLGVGAVFSPVLAYLTKPYLNLNPDFLLVMAIVLIGIMTNTTAIYRLIWTYRKLGEKPANPPAVEKKELRPSFLLHETHTRGRA